MAASKQPGEEQAQVRRPDIRAVTVPIEGLSSLICHKWSEKARQQMLAKQTKAARTAKEAKDPEADYQASLYVIEDGVYGFPASAFKNAMVRAAQYADEKMTYQRGAFFVTGDLVRIDGEPKMREDMVRVSGGTADIRYRGEFPDWRAELTIQFNARAVSAEQVVNLLAIAGFSVGVGDWRPEKNGDHGRFRVVSA